MWLPISRQWKKQLTAGALALGLAGSAALAQGDGSFQSTPEKYLMIFSKVGLCPDLACPSPIVLGTQAAPYDIASVGPGGAIGSFSAGSSLPPGTYTHLYIVLGRDIVYRGRVRMTTGGNDYDCVTNGSQQDLQRGVIDGDLVTPGSGTTRDITAKFASMFENGREFIEGNTRWKIASDTEIEVAAGLPQPIVVTAGQPAPSIRISIDAAGALWGGVNQGGPSGPTCYLYGEAPAITLRTD